MRTSGVLMHISSLPSSQGIGTFGKSAYKFVDMLRDAGQTYWQILPLCPTSFGDSPYQSFSTFAGNPYFIDLEILEKQGYIFPEEYKSIDFGQDSLRVDYEKIYFGRNKVFDFVEKHFFENLPSDYEEFCVRNASWLDDYSLFMALKDEFDGKSFCDWPEKIKGKDPDTLASYREKLKNKIPRYKMLQYLFFDQWGKLKGYANENGIKIIGDLPIYVALDSADVWANPKNFIMDEQNIPTVVAGCPPDAFSKKGQLWGNPVYDWDYMKADNYSWWVERMRFALKMYDVIRIDHFRGFDSFYCIENGRPDATVGEWRKGPGMDLFRALKKELGTLPVIAEDLGFLTPSVKRLLKASKFPGMKVLQFAFSAGEDADYLPHNYTKNSVVYTGTHDNDTIIGWIKSARRAELKYAREYMNCKRDLNKAMMRTAMASVSDTAILTMQDLLYLGKEARMNVPSTLGTNWMWRVSDEQLNEHTFDLIKSYTKTYARERKKEKK